MRIRELDGLRGIAVLAVMNRHYLSWLPMTGSHFGWLGVDLFFVLSGFLITSILLQLRVSQNYFSTFYARRSLRILPPYLLGIAVYLCASIIAGKPGTIGLWAQFIFYYTSLQVGQPAVLDSAVGDTVRLGLVVLWSLSVEEIYYTLWAPVVRYTSRRGFIVVIASMIVVAPVMRWALHTPFYPETYTFYCRMDALAFGSLVALLNRSRQANSIAWERWSNLIDRMTLAVTLATTVFYLALGGDRSNIWISTAGIEMADISFALITFTVLRKAGGSAWWIRALRARWLRSVGMVSYSLYLFHYPLGHLVGMWVATWGLSQHQDAIVQVLLSILVSFAVAYGLWYGMESRILNWKDRHVPSPAHP